MQYCNQTIFHYDGCGAGLLFPPNSFSRISFQMSSSSSLSVMNFTFMAPFFSQCQILLKKACYNFPLHLLFFSWLQLGPRTFHISQPYQLLLQLSFVHLKKKTNGEKESLSTWKVSLLFKVARPSSLMGTISIFESLILKLFGCFQKRFYPHSFCKWMNYTLYMLLNASTLARFRNSWKHINQGENTMLSSFCNI